MAPLKHDCLFPLTTPTCQWAGHAAPETAPRLQQRSPLYVTLPLRSRTASHHREPVTQLQTRARLQPFAAWLRDTIDSFGNQTHPPKLFREATESRLSKA
ncbi:hypothetical protein K0M31_012976 [Melipona bicolor]|uniref:Uncharacterized protein n=1 Tax=Melipona bicolor TaxID=60889 RepID=A0AA40FIV8_9HYME|nr:hypothetical protein K0M31_012976 [Melipona bicolor]